METLDFPESFVACDLKIGRYRHFIVLLIMCLFTLTNKTLAKGHLSETKYQVSEIRTIGTLVHLLMTN